MNWPLLQNSLLVAAATTVFAAVLGVTAALALAGSGKSIRHGALALAAVALALPPFLVTNCWLDLLGGHGAWREWLPLNIFSTGGVVWILTLLTWPFFLFAALGAWRRLEPGQLESDPALCGAKLFRWLLWPMARSSLGLAGAIVFVLALNQFAVPAILQVKVFPAEVWVGFNTNLDNLAALKLGWPLIVTPVLLLLVLQHRDLRWPRGEGGVSAAPFRRQLGGGWFGFSRVLTLLALVFSVAVPLAQLGGSRRTWSQLLPALEAGWPAVGHSFCLAAVTATLTVGAGIVWGQVVRTPKGGGTLLWLLFFTPGIFLGIALIFIFNRPGLDWFYRGAGVMLFALVTRYLAVGGSGAAGAIRRADRELIDAARLDGARGWTLFRRVLWPQTAPQLAAAWHAVYLLCLWDVETLLLVLPPGGETLALRVFNLLHYGHNSQVNALCIWLLVLAVAPLAAWTLWRAARTRWTVAMVLTVIFSATLTGCKPSVRPSEFLIDSKIFSRVQIIGARGTGSGEFNKPRSLALDTNDNLFVVDMTGRVQKFSPAGKFLLSWQMPQTDLGKPKGMDCDRDGNIIVLEPHYQRVNHFTPAGRLVRQWGVRGTNAHELTLPRSVAVNSRGDIFLSEYTLVDRVHGFAARDQQLLVAYGVAGEKPGEFNRVEGLGIDAQDRVYVADSCNHRIQIFSRDGRLLRTHGRAGSGRGELSYPYDVRIDRAGRQYVCEFGNSRIQIFDAQDGPVEILGGAGAGPGQFSNPWSVALDSHGNLYVADSQNHRVQKFIRTPAGSRGHWPVPSGDPPLGTGKAHDLFYTLVSSSNVLPVPSGQWPDGTGGSPVLPIAP